MRATIHVPDAGNELTAVRLVSDLPLDEQARTFARQNGGWELRLPVGLRLERLEYLVELERDDGATETVRNPANGATAPGAFGEKSVWIADAYREPWWMSGDPVEGRVETFTVKSRALRRKVEVAIWSPADAKPHRALPLLVANDGPEYDALSLLTRHVAVELADYAMPRCRVALLTPGNRDEWYSANPAYARALTQEILPAIAPRAPQNVLPVGMGASLGGLAMLHAQRRHPGTFGGLFLQSGSFFVPRFDAHEQGFPRYPRIVRLTRAVLRASSHGETIPVTLTCGSEEENVHNNRLMAAALSRQGYDVTLHEVGDLHNYTAWRDAFDPHLPDLLLKVWRP